MLKLVVLSALVLVVSAASQSQPSARVSDVTSMALPRAALRALATRSMEAVHRHTEALSIVRVPGTPGAERARDYLLSTLAATAPHFVVEQDSFLASTPQGQRFMSNVVATWNPRNASRRVVVAAHYDSKYGVAGAGAF